MSDQWQNKYNELLENYQIGVAQNEARISRLQSSFTCMSLLVNGFDLALDKQLSNLVQCLQKGKTDQVDFSALNRVIRGSVDSRKKLLASVKTELSSIIRCTKDTVVTSTPKSLAARFEADFADLEQRVLSETRMYLQMPHLLRELAELQRRGVSAQFVRGDEDSSSMSSHHWKRISHHLFQIIRDLDDVSEPGSLPDILNQARIGEWEVQSIPELLSRLRALLHCFRPSTDLDQSDVLGHIEGSLRQLIQITDNTLSLILADSEVNSEACRHAQVKTDDLRRWVSDNNLVEPLRQSLLAHVDQLDERLSEMATINEKQKVRDQELAYLRSQLVQLDSDYQNLKTTLEETEAASAQDSLTQLPNRDAYLARAQKEMDAYLRSGRTFVLALCDVDHFKQFNDSFGHQVGDQVLFQVAQLLRKNIRDKDFVARYGGEEFVLILPNCNSSGAMNSLNRLREKFSSIGHDSGDGVVPITASFGIAEAVSGDTIDSLFYKADMALYRAKSRGRNRCVVEIPSEKEHEMA